MIKKELFDKTIDILVKAYQNDTLKHRSCRACAVGNIIASNCNFSFDENFNWINSKNSNIFPYWEFVFVTTHRIKQHIYESEYVGIAKEQIDSTGYTWQELAKIEYAFETCEHSNDKDQWMFNGLMAVVDVLFEIHQVGNDTTTKQKFEKVRELT